VASAEQQLADRLLRELLQGDARRLGLADDKVTEVLSSMKQQPAPRAETVPAVEPPQPPPRTVPSPGRWPSPPKPASDPASAATCYATPSAPAWSAKATTWSW